MNDFLDLLTKHIALVGWPTLCLLVWKAARYFTKAEERITSAEDTLDTLATNHLPHLQESVDKLSSTMEKGLDQINGSVQNLHNALILVSKK